NLLAADEREPAAGDGAAELVRNGGEVNGDGLVHRRERGGVGGVRVDNAIHVRPVTVDVEMAGRVRGGLEFAFDDFAVQVHDDHLLRPQVFIAHAGGLDDDVLSLRIPRANIAAGPGD